MSAPTSSVKTRDVNWTDIGAKVKQLIDQRISAEVREMMQPVSILDQDFDEKIAHLPHPRSPGLCHGARHPRPDPRAAGAKSRFSTSAYPSVSPDSSSRCGPSSSTPPKPTCRWPICRREVHGEATVAARHGLSPVSLAIYEILPGTVCAG